MKIIFIISISLLEANAHHKHGNDKIEKSEKTYHVELADRVVTVQRLKGPPPKKAQERTRKSTPQGVHAQSILPTETFFLHSVVCEDGRTFLEWWSLSQPPKVVHQAWSNLDWAQSSGLNSFQHKKKKYTVMHFHTISSKAELAKLGKPHDPRSNKLTSRSHLKNEHFIRVDQNQITTSSLQFMKSCHEYLKSGKQLKQSNGRRPQRASGGKTIAPKKKLSTLRYWRAE